MTKGIHQNDAPAQSERKHALLQACSAVRYIVALLGCAYIISYIAVALARIHYPFELQWMEGASALQVRQILSSRQLYVAPSLEFIPMIYTPLYYYVSALIAGLIGSGFLSLRLVSFISSLGCMVLIYRFVKGEGYGRWLAITTVGLFAATYALTRGWFDIARVDSMFLFLALWALYILRSARSSWSMAAAGILAAMAFQTKQSELPIIAVMIVYAVYAHRQRAIYFVATSLGLIAISAVLINYSTNGWYNYYVFSLPSKHPIDEAKWMSFWFNDLTPTLKVAIVVSILYLLRGLDWTHNKNQAMFYMCATAGMIATSWSGRLHSGGYVNVVIPAYAWISVLFGLGIGRCLERAHANHNILSLSITLIIYGLCIFQYASLLYDPIAFVPSAADYYAGQALVRSIAEVNGDVFVPFHPYIATLAGKHPSFHRMAFADIDRSTDEATKNRLHEELDMAVSQGRFDTIILDDFWLRDRVSLRYKSAGPAFEHTSEFWPKTGLPKRPQYIYTLRNDPKSAL